MADMLVRLYELPDYSELVNKLHDGGVEIRRVLAPEVHLVPTWVAKHFSAPWAAECAQTVVQTPATCFIAVEHGALLGFACYNAVCPDFFGPTGVKESARGRGIGKALLWVCLRALADEGYGYAIIGWAGPTEFYKKAVGAEVIERSAPGVFRGILGEQA
jgi:GNAT superfamily N-acetyltransferase